MEKLKITYIVAFLLPIVVGSMCLIGIITGKFDYGLWIIPAPVMLSLAIICFDVERKKSDTPNRKQQRDALIYVSRLNCGSKDSFVRAHGPLVYNCFIRKGVIKELRHEDNIPMAEIRWEITPSGRKAVERL